VPDLRNYLDADGHELCMLCGHALRPSDSVLRVDDCMVHVHCWLEEPEAEMPCEATEPTTQ
jgi:hypothetical protein